MTKPARASISSNLPSSDGWKVKNGSSIQRCEPRVGGAEHETSDDRDDHRRVDARPELAEARVVDAGEGEHQGDPDDRVDRLADHVVVADRRGRRRGSSSASVKTLKAISPIAGDSEQRVEVGEARALARLGARLVEACAARARLGERSAAHSYDLRRIVGPTLDPGSGLTSK